MEVTKHTVYYYDPILKECEALKLEKEKELKKRPIINTSNNIIDEVSGLLKRVDEHIDDMDVQLSKIDVKKQELDSEMVQIDRELKDTPRYIRKTNQLTDKQAQMEPEQIIESWDALSIVLVSFLICLALFFASAEMISISFLLKNYVPGFEATNSDIMMQRIIIGFIVFGINIGLEVAFENSSKRIKAITKACAIIFAITGLFSFLASFILEVTFLNTFFQSNTFSLNSNANSEIIQVSRMVALFIGSFGSAYILMGKVLDIFKHKGKHKLYRNSVYQDLKNEFQLYEMICQKLTNYRRHFKNLIEKFKNLRKGIFEKGKEMVINDAIKQYEKIIQSQHIAISYLSQEKFN